MEILWFMYNSNLASGADRNRYIIRARITNPHQPAISEQFTVKYAETLKEIQCLI
jgi:hypothetical protein